MIKLYSSLGSGNSYKPALLMRLLGVEYETIKIDVRGGEHRKPEFLQVTPFGQVPVLVDGAAVLTDSQAILCYLARAYGGAAADSWLPSEPLQLAKVMRWLSVAANEIQNGPTTARAALLLKWPIDYDLAVRRSYRLLKIMDAHLETRDWLATGHMTIADIACYPYLFLAAEGGVDTAPFPAVEAWLRRFESMDNFWPIPRVPGLAPVPLVPVPA